MVVLDMEDENSDGHHAKYKKYVEELRGPAKRTLASLNDTLKKSENTFNVKICQKDSKEEKAQLTKKLEKIRKEIQILKDLSVDDVIKFALTTQQNIMAIAANPRLSKALRMKARVASHKPLSTHLARVKRKLNDSEESESEEEQVDNSSKSLNKMCLNNQIVKMRKEIKRAKIFIIHKFTKDIKKLRSYKGSGKLKEKYERKAERLVKKLQYFKELHEDEIARFALTTTQDVTKLAVDVRMPMRTQAIATIAAHKFVAQPVAEFRTLYPDWQKTIPVLMKKKKKKRKLNVEAKESVQVSNKTSDPKSRTNDSDEEHSEAESDGNSDEENESDQLDETRSEEEESGQEDEGETDESEESTESEEEEAVSNFKDSDSIDCSQDDPGMNNNNKVHTKHLVKQSKKEPADLPQKNIKSDMKNISNISKRDVKVSKKVVQKSKPIENEPKVVDPFFVTTTNEEYVTSQVPVATDTSRPSWKEDDDSFPKKRKMFDKFDTKAKWRSKEDNWKQNKFNHRENGPYKKPLTSCFEKFPNKNGPPVNTFGNRKERRKMLNQPVKEEKVEKLHPSWEAKKKQTIIAPFKGKKITFD